MMENALNSISVALPLSKKKGNNSNIQTVLHLTF